MQTQTSPEELSTQHPAWQRVQLASHPKRPHATDYIEKVFTDFQEIHGDRLFAEDPAIICGMATFENASVMVVAEQKGRDTKKRYTAISGCPNRKVIAKRFVACSWLLSSIVR
jgi:acetyl-CoA carboxylase carboxyl transferase subunit alpha